MRCNLVRSNSVRSNSVRSNEMKRVIFWDEDDEENRRLCKMKKIIIIAMLLCMATAVQATDWFQIDCNNSSYHQGHMVNLENLVDIERTGDTTLRLSYYGHRSLFEIECDSKYHTEQVMQELQQRIKQ